MLYYGEITFYLMELNNSMTSKSSVDKTFTSAEEKFVQLTDLLRSNPVKRMKLSEVESLISHEGRELLCCLLQDYVDDRGLCDVGEFVTGSDGIIRSHKRASERKIRSLFGVIQIERMGYSSRGASSLFPKDGLLNLPKISYSFGLQKLIVQEAIRGSFEEGIKSIERMVGFNIPKRQAEKIVLNASNDFYRFYEQYNSYPIPTEPTKFLLIMTLDGKGIAMRKEALKEETAKRAEKTQHKFKQRLSPGEKKNFKRIAAVASVYLVEPFLRTQEEIIEELFNDERVSTGKKRSKPVEKRVWASLEHSFKAVVSEIFEEAKKKDPNQQYEWVALVDGDKKQIIYLLQEAKKQGISITVVCDFIHVLEYLWEAGHTFFGGASESEKWVKERLLWILEGKSSLTAAGMRRSATKRKFTELKRKDIDKCAGYLLNLAPYLKYHDYLRKGYPIATGVIEGACRHLVKDRMGITGARWGLKGAEAILKLRSLKVSGEFENYWEFYEQQEFIRNHIDKYAEPNFFVDNVS